MKRYIEKKNKLPLLFMSLSNDSPQLRISSIVGLKREIETILQRVDTNKTKYKES